MKTYKADFLNTKDSNFYYILGMFATDGTIYFNPSKRAYRAYLYSNDKEILEKINDYFCDENCIYKNRNCFALTISNKLIVEEFMKNGIHSNKSLNIQLPKVPVDYLPDFIRGCLDGDGTIGIFKNGKYKQPTCTLCSSSLDFITSYKEILDQFEISYCYTIQGKKTVKILGATCDCQEHYRVQVKQAASLIKLLTWAYYPNHSLSMKRKYDQVLEILAFNNKTTIKNV